MADVFISYSRKDTEFVRCLHEALAQQNRDTWVDWEDIPLTADWWKEICAGIEAANTFVFVISPDSVRSKVCFDEIEHAAKNSKRIVPILRRDVTEEADRQRTHPTINAHNWLFFRAEDEFHEAFQLLLDALDTDLDHVRRHTRLLVRAREWDFNERNSSLLLQGSDLTEAESWLTQGIAKEPRPIPLHSEYISASRAAQNRRQRSLLSGVSAALLITLALTALSFLLFRQSEDRRAESDQRGTAVAHQAATATNALGVAEQRGTAVAQQAATATNALGIAEQRGTAVAQQAATATNALGMAEQRGTAVAQQAATAEANLRQVWNTQALFLADLANQRSVEYDNRQAVLLALEGLAHYGESIYNGENHFALMTALAYPYWAEMNLDLDRSIPSQTIGGLDKNKVDALWNADGTRLVSWYNSPIACDDDCVYEAVLWDAISGEKLLIFPHQEYIQDISLSPDGTRLLTETQDYIVRIWDTSSGEKLLTLPTSALYGETWNADGSRIMTWGRNQTAQVWDAHTGENLLVLPHDAFVWGGKWSPDETRIVTWRGALCVNCDFDVQIWDAATGEHLSTLSFKTSVQDVVWSDDGQRLLITTSEGSPSVWDGENLLTFESDITDRAQWNQDETQLLTLNGSRECEIDCQYEVRIWDTRTGERRMTLRHETLIDGAAWNADETRLLTWTNDGKVYLWNTITGERFFDTDGRKPAWNASGSYILLWQDGDPQVWDARSLEEALPVGDNSITTATWSPDGVHLITIAKNFTSTIWTFLEHASVVKLPHEAEIRGAIWNQDKTRLLTWSSDGIARIWDAATWTVVFEVYQNKLANAAWNPDESRLWTWSNDDNVGGTRAPSQAWVWDLSTGEKRFALSYNGEGAIWNKDETGLLVWNQWTGMVYLLDAASGEPSLSLNAGGEVGSAWWNGDETKLLIDSGEGLLSVWDTASGEKLFEMRHDGGIWGAAWNKDDTRILSWSSDNTARLWDASSGENLLIMPHADWANEAIWNADETQIMTRSNDGTAKVWDAATGENLLTLEHDDTVFGGRWNQDETQILTWSADGTARLWDARTGEELLVLSHGQSVYNAMWNTDETQILTSLFSTNWVWDVQSGDSIFGMWGNEDAAWNADETQIMAWSEKTVYIWLVDLEKLMDLGNSLNLAPLTDSERARYFLPPVD